MEHVFKLFAEYANKIERETNGRHVPSLQLYSDCSGCIEDRNEKLLYVSFSNIDQLTQYLEEDNQHDGATCLTR